MQFSPFELENKFKKEDPKKLLELHIQSRITTIQQGDCDKTPLQFQQNPFFLFCAKSLFKLNINFSKEMQQELRNFIKNYLYNPTFELVPCFEGLVINLHEYYLLLDVTGYVEYGGLADGSLERLSVSRVFQKSIEEIWGIFFIKVLSIMNKHQKLSPLLLSYTLTNVKDAEIGYINKSPFSCGWNRAQKILKKNKYTIISDPVSCVSEESLKREFVTLFNRIWNAAGELRSPFSPHLS